MLELLSLLQNGRSWPATNLAAKVGTSPRTLRRDLDRLRELGYPVSSTRGPGGSYQLVAGRAMPPLLFTDDEAVATVVGLRMAAYSQMGGADEAADGALHKLERVVPKRLRARIQALTAATETAVRAAQGPDLQTVQLFATTAHTHQHVRFDYISRSGKHTGRRVEPYRQVLLGRRWYLLGWDHDRADWRTYRIDRISALSVPGTTFAPRELPTDDPVSFVQNHSQFPRTSQRGVVRFAAPVSVVSEKLIAEAGSLEAIDDTSCRYIASAESWEWLSVTLAAIGVPYTIESPPELISYSRKLADRIAEATGS